MVTSVNQQFCDYSKAFNEVILHSQKYKIAGTTDKLCFRTKKIDGVVDIYDYKTNESRGIEFENKYGDFFAPPLNHLEDCNYVKYAMQLSSYGVMAQEMFNCKIGKLAIIFIPPTDPNNWIKIPVPYMKHEAVSLMEKNTPIVDQWNEALDAAPMVFSNSNDDFIPKFK